MPPIFYKDSASRKQRQVYLIYIEAQPIFYKDSANREQRDQTSLNNYAEMPPIFYKDNASRKQRQVYLIYVEAQPITLNNRHDISAIAYTCYKYSASSKISIHKNGT